MKYEKAIILIETQSKSKEKIVVELADTTKKGTGYNAVIKFLQEGMLLFGKEQITYFLDEKNLCPARSNLFGSNK